MISITIAAVFSSLGTGASDELQPPILVEAAGGPIDVGGGHAAPLFVDVDGDGLQDLLVGQFAGAKARVYRNVGTAGFPRFEDFQYLVADGSEAVVPAS